MTETFYTPKDLARRWGVSTRTLDRWRRIGSGPKYLKIGWLVAYRKSDIAEFEDRQTRNPGRSECDV